MPYISTFMYCENTQNENTPEGNKLHIIGPMHIITPMFIPSMFSFCVTFGILDLCLNEQHILRYVFKSPNGEIVVDTKDIHLPIQELKEDLPKEMNGILLNMDFRNIALKIEGKYNSEIFVDEHSLGVFPIGVKGMSS